MRQAVSRTGLTLIAAIAFGACAGSSSEGDHTPASAILNAVPQEQPPVALAVAAPTLKQSVREPEPVKSPPAVKHTDPQLLGRAQALVEVANKQYRAGEYDKAEASLKEAVTLYPFVAEANLLLGKVFLLRGSALRDVSLVNSARLMFEMAHTIDPTMREAELLLGLFHQAPPE
jgi:tetratricopeptide (TPR) repeat protein